MEARWNNHVVIERALINHYMRIQGALFITFFSVFFPLLSFSSFPRHEQDVSTGVSHRFVCFRSLFPFSRMVSAILNNWANPENWVFLSREETEASHAFATRKHTRYVCQDEDNFAQVKRQKFALRNAEEKELYSNSNYFVFFPRLSRTWATSQERNTKSLAILYYSFVYVFYPLSCFFPFFVSFLSFFLSSFLSCV